MKRTFPRLLGALANLGLSVVGLRLMRAAHYRQLNENIHGLRDRIRQQNKKIQALTRVTISDDVRQALALAPEALAAPQPEPYPVDFQPADADPASSRELFRLNGEMLACWQDSDFGLYDDWLTHPANYPAYAAFFRQYGLPGQRVRLLEIGVRTGYLAAVFARASREPAFYAGVDPNQYVANGLVLAGATLRRLRETLPDFEFALIEGYSNDGAVQRSLHSMQPFDMVHIDGDHSLEGKLIDLDLARRLIHSDGLVLVDDYDHHPPVHEAIRRAKTLGWYREIAYIPTMRGLAVLRC